MGSCGVTARGGLWGLIQRGIMVLNVQHCAVQRANEESVSFSDSRPFLLGWSGFGCCLLTFVCSDPCFGQHSCFFTFVHLDLSLWLPD